MSKLAIVGGTVIDGNGGTPLAGGTVIVSDGLIEAVGGAGTLPVPDGAEVIDATGKIVMPGLIDCHQHVGTGFVAVKRLQDNLRRGTTTVAGVTGGPGAVALRQAIADGLIDRCPHYWVGGVVDATGGHLEGLGGEGAWITADGPWEVRRAVRQMAKDRVDFIKTAASGGFQWEFERVEWEDYTLEELVALVEEAHAKDKRVVVHAHSQPGLNHAIAAGCDMIHHGALIDEEALHGIARRGLHYAPTLHITSKPVWTNPALPPHMRERMEHAHPIHREGVRTAHAMGLPMHCGTDGGPGDAAHELMELCDCGLSPMEAIVCATRNSAEALGILDRTGTLEPGKEADLIVVAGDPLADISVLYEAGNIALVMRKAGARAVCLRPNADGERSGTAG